MVYCGPHEGRHTGVLIGEKIDEIINDLNIDGLSADTMHRAMTTDNASNMKVACDEAKTIDCRVGCFDHLLNIVVNTAIKRVPGILTSVNKFKRLATGTHKSTLHCERIQQECIQLQNSATKHKKKCLQFINDHPIPVAAPLLAGVAVPEPVTGNKKFVSCHQFAVLMYHDLVQRFPQNSTQNYIVATTCILNPALKGFIVKDAGNLDYAVARMIAAEEGVPEDAGSDLNEAMILDPDDEDAMMIAQLTQRHEEATQKTKPRNDQSCFLYLCL